MQLPLFLWNIKFIKTKDTFFSHIPEKQRDGGLTVDASVEKGEKLGSWGWLRLGSDAKLFSSWTLFEIGLPKLDRFSTAIIHLFLGSLFLCMIGFFVHETKENFSHWKAAMDWRLRLYYINAALYCYVFERENYKSYYFNSTLRRQSSIYDQGGCSL